MVASEVDKMSRIVLQTDKKKKIVSTMKKELQSNSDIVENDKFNGINAKILHRHWNSFFEELWD